MARRNATSPASIAAAARRREAVALRMLGRTFAEIGAALGVSRPQAFRLVADEIERAAAEAKEELGVLRALESDRLDALHAAAWPLAMKGELDAIDRVLRISARRAAMFGLDRPVKVAPTDPTGEGEFTGGGLAALLKAAG